MPSAKRDDPWWEQHKQKEKHQQEFDDCLLFSYFFLFCFCFFFSFRFAIREPASYSDWFLSLKASSLSPLLPFFFFYLIPSFLPYYPFFISYFLLLFFLFFCCCLLCRPVDFYIILGRSSSPSIAAGYISLFPTLIFFCHPVLFWWFSSSFSVPISVPSSSSSSSSSSCKYQHAIGIILCVDIWRNIRSAWTPAYNIVYWREK